MKGERGFTLLELLVALVIVVSASAVILAHLRTLMDVESRLRRSQSAVSQLLDQAALISYRNFSGVNKSLQKDRIHIPIPGEDNMNIQLFNHPARGDGSVPIDLAFTPFQEYRLEHGRFGITFIYRGLASAGL